MPEIVVASQNEGKAREIARILSGYTIRTLAEFDPIEFPEEGGEYSENARVKAVTAARALGIAAIADDSGLEVAALDGAPGPYSARFGGPDLDDRGRVEKMLEVLSGTPAPRHARFYCVAACALPDGQSVTADGSCEGEIVSAPSGDGGFGYDPIFRPAGFDRVMAEMTREEKDSLSHRGAALRALAPKVTALLGSAPPNR